MNAVETFRVHDLGDVTAPVLDPEAPCPCGNPATSVWRFVSSRGRFELYRCGRCDLLSAVGPR